MRGRRHKLQVSTFPFLAVLLCAMGSLILVLLVMDRKAHKAAQARAQHEAQRMAEETARSAAERQAEADRRRQQAQAAHENKRAELHTKLSREQIELQLQMRKVREQLSQIAARLRYEQDTSTQLRRKVQDERGKLQAEQQLLLTLRSGAGQAETKSKESNKTLQHMTIDLLRMEQALKDLKAAKQREQHTFSVVPYHGRRGENRRPIYVECAATGVIFHPERRAMPVVPRDVVFNRDRPDPSTNEVRAEVERRIAQQRQKLTGSSGSAKATAYLLLLVRPDGILTYHTFQALLKGLDVDFGYEFVDADWILDFPADDDQPSTQPWMIATKKPTPAAAPPAAAARNTRPLLGTPNTRGVPHPDRSGAGGPSARVVGGASGGLAPSLMPGGAGSGGSAGGGGGSAGAGGGRYSGRGVRFDQVGDGSTGDSGSGGDGWELPRGGQRFSSGTAGGPGGPGGGASGVPGAGGVGGSGPGGSGMAGRGGSGRPHVPGAPLSGSAASGGSEAASLGPPQALASGSGVIASTAGGNAGSPGIGYPGGTGGGGPGMGYPGGNGGSSPGMGHGERGRVSAPRGGSGGGSPGIGYPGGSGGAPGMGQPGGSGSSSPGMGYPGGKDGSSGGIGYPGGNGGGSPGIGSPGGSGIGGLSGVGSGSSGINSGSPRVGSGSPGIGMPGSGPPGSGMAGSGLAGSGGTGGAAGPNGNSSLPPGASARGNYAAGGGTGGSGGQPGAAGGTGAAPATPGATAGEGGPGTGQGGSPASGQSGGSGDGTFDPLLPREAQGDRTAEQPPAEEMRPGSPRKRPLLQGGNAGEGGGEGGVSESFATPSYQTRRPHKPVSMRPAWVHGGRDWIIFVECLGDGVKLYPSEKIFPLAQAARGGADNPLTAAIRQMIERRQALRRPGEPPYYPQVRLLVRPENVRTFLTIYPALSALPVPKTRQNLDAEDDVNDIINGANP